MRNSILNILHHKNVKIAKHLSLTFFMKIELGLLVLETWDLFVRKSPYNKLETNRLS